MSQKSDDIVVRIKAETAKFRDELKSLERQLDAFDGNVTERARSVTDRMRSLGASLSPVAVGFTAVAAAGATAFAAFRQQAQAADDLASAAARVQFDIANFQATTDALERLDVSTSQTEAALGRLLRASGEAQGGSRELADAFGRLGIAAGDLERLNNEALFDRVARGLGGIESPAERAALAVRLFGREAGLALATALADGGTALRQWQAEAIAAGRVIDTALAQKLADANDTLERFGKQWTVVMANAAGRVLPLVEAITGISAALDGSAADAERWAQRLRDIERPLLTSGFLVAGVAAGAAADRLDPVSPARQELTEVRRRIAAGEIALQDGRISLADFGDGSPQGLGVLRLREKELLGIISQARAPGSGSAGRTTAPPPGPARPAGAPVIPVEDPARAAVARVARTRAALAPASDPYLAMIQQSGASLAAEARVRGATQVSADPQLSRLLAQTGAGLIDLEGALPDLSAALAEAAERTARWQEVTERTSLAAAQAVLAGEDLGDVFKRLAVQMLLVEPATQGLQGLIKGLLDSIGGNPLDGVFGAIGKGIGAIFGGGFASGGRPPMGKVSLVGEAGPELFVPSAPGTIVSNADIAAALDWNAGLGARVAAARPVSQTVVSIAVDARGASNPAEVEAAGYRGAQRALAEAAPALREAAVTETLRRANRRRL